MSLVTWYDQAHLHREVCIAILDAFLPHGSIRKLAAAVGVTVQWFTSFRQADSFAMPSLLLGRRIADQLPAPDGIRRGFYEHLAAARHAYRSACREVRATTNARLPVHDYLSELHLAFYQANFGPDPARTLSNYQCALALARTLATNLSPDAYPLELMEVCGTMLHLSVALDDLPTGLYWIKVANHVAAQLRTADLAVEQQRTRFRHLRYLLARDEALGYHHFGNDRTALRCYERAEHALSEHPNPRSQYGDLARNRLLALAGIPRFTISEAEGLAHRAIPIFEQKADGLGLLLNRQALARAYVVQGGTRNLRRAERSLHDLLEELYALPNAGQIHRVVVMQTLGHLYWRRGDQTEWQRVMTGLLPLTRQAGLLYFTNRLKHTYGPALNSILESVG